MVRPHSPRRPGLALAFPAVLIVLALLPESLHAGVDRWSPVAPSGGSIVELLVDPSRPATLYTLTSSTGPPYKTVDAGGRWVVAGRGLSDAPVQALALDPGAPDHLVLSAGSYAGARDDWGVFRSDDGGIGWYRVDGAPIPLLFFLALAPAPDSAFFGIGTSDPFGATFGLFRSRDGGASWQELLRADSFFFFHDLVVDPHAPRTLYLATEDGVLRSLDAGDTWAALGRLEDGSPLGSIARVAPAAGDSAVLYASRTGDLFRSADGGQTWREIPVALPNGSDCALRPLIVHPADPATLWAGCASGVAISRDGGFTWVLQTVATAVRAVTALAIDPGSPHVLYAGTSDDGVFKSTSAGDGWSPASAGIREAQIRILAFDPVLPDVLYGSRSRGPCAELLVSPDGGRSWSALPPASSCLEEPVLAVSPVDRSNLYLGDRHGLRVSRDGGMTWRRRYAGGVGAISIDPRRPKTVYLGGSGIVRSQDGGRTWIQVLAARSGGWARNVHQVLADPSHPGVVYASGLDVIRGSADPFALRSTDAGATWRSLDLATAADSFQAAPGPSGVIVTGQPGYETSTPTEWSRTNDGGATWEAFTVPGSRLLLVPSQPYRLLTSDGEAILRSDDGGGSWRAVGSWTGCNLGPGELAAASGPAPDVVFAYGCAGTLAAGPPGAMRGAGRTPPRCTLCRIRSARSREPKATLPRC